MQSLFVEILTCTICLKPLSQWDRDQGFDSSKDFSFSNPEQILCGFTVLQFPQASSDKELMVDFMMMSLARSCCSKAPNSRLFLPNMYSVLVPK